MGIDPVFRADLLPPRKARFVTTGEATKTLSLGNECCIPDRPCIDQAQGGYAQMRSWEDGFEHWYRLIRDGYVQGQVTIPLVGPSLYHRKADHSRLCPQCRSQ